METSFTECVFHLLLLSTVGIAARKTATLKSKVVRRLAVAGLSNPSRQALHPAPNTHAHTFTHACTCMHIYTHKYTLM